MARVKSAGPEQLSDADRAIYERAMSYGSFGSQIGAIANRPPILRHLYPMLLELREEGVLSRRHLELALVTASQLNACTYCVSHHAPYLGVEGVSEEAARGILEPERFAEFDDVDRLVIEYARQVTEQPNRVRDAMFDRLREHFSDAQIVELTWRTALCGAFNRFNDVLQVEIEDGVEVVEHSGAENAA